MNAYCLKNAIGIDRIPYDVECNQIAETVGNMIELNYNFKDLDANVIHQSVELRVVLATAAGDTGAIDVRGVGNIVSCVIGNTRGLVLDKFTADGELASFRVKTVAPTKPATAATPLNTESALSLDITAPAGAYTTYVKIYNQLGVLVNERTVTWA